MALSLYKKRDENLTDKQLLEKYYSSGKIDLLADLYRRYMELVYGVCLKYFRNREDSQDAVMDIFEKLISELSKHRVDNFRSWLYTLTKNFCLMKLRSTEGKINKQLNIEDHEYIFMDNEFEMHPVNEGNTDMYKKLELCIEKLKKEQRNCIRLFYFENKCYREIAQQMELDEKSVKSYLQNAKRNLKICMDGNYEE